MEKNKDEKERTEKSYEQKSGNIGILMHALAIIIPNNSHSCFYQLVLFSNFEKMEKKKKNKLKIKDWNEKVVHLYLKLEIKDD
jgi:hypothetical protein